jgi:hypothetical protein
VRAIARRVSEAREQARVEGERARPVALLRAATRSDDRRNGVAGSPEAALRVRLADDPNDERAFVALADLVRRQAADGHIDEERRPRAANDAVWALAEELAHNKRAWFPLIELGRLSAHDDIDGAQRRLAAAVEREPTGRALAEGLAMLRREGMPDAALSLGVGHWRPREHIAAAGREMVLAAVEAGRLSEARRHLEALTASGDVDVSDLRIDLDELARRTAKPHGGLPI